MTEALSLATSAPAHPRPPLSTADFTPYHHTPVPSASLNTEETADDDDGEIACICAFNGDDGNTIQCDKCLRWQHISCYYPPPKEVPGEDQKHYCSDCVPQADLDSRRATDRQRRLLEQRNGVNGVKRPAAKSSKKKVKDSPSLSAQVNGWSDRHTHLQNHDRKSASPRDHQPPAKKPKTSHRNSNSISNPSGRKRASTVNVHPPRSPSKSPELITSTFIPQYSDEFLHLSQPQPQSPQVDTDTNLMNNIAVTNLLSDWLTNPVAVARVTGGLKQTEIFKRWDGQMDDIPGRPEVSVDWSEDQTFISDGITPRWARLTVLQQITSGTFIGELRGRIGLRDDYIHEVDGRWGLLHHPEPFVFFHPQLPICIDARQEGSRFRFVRRSCSPNAELQTIITEGTEYHFCFMASRDILADEEITVGWQVPDTIRERINSSLAQSNNFQPKVRDYFSTWVSNVLSNCGPCACNNPTECLMARYDRRGRSPPLQPAKSTKRKKKLPTLDPTATSRSRSGSEIRKTDQEEDHSESRSASGSRGSVSRDITPSTHYSGNPSVGGFQELSERERKKLMREEEMFRRQEEESGRQKKKRNSGGAALNTPSAPSSVRSFTLDGQKRPRVDGPEQKHSSSQFNGTSRADDGCISGRPHLSQRTSSGKRKTGASSKSSRRESALPPRSMPVTYVDASVQCDLDEVSVFPKVNERPRKRYVSVTQRLFQKCISNNFKLKNEEEVPSEPLPDAKPGDSMDIDSEVPSAASNVPDNSAPSLVPKVAADELAPVKSASSSSPGDDDIVMEDVNASKSPQVEQKAESEFQPVPLPPSSSLAPSVPDQTQKAVSQPGQEQEHHLPPSELGTQPRVNVEQLANPEPAKPPSPSLLFSSSVKEEAVVPSIPPPAEPMDMLRSEDVQSLPPPKDSPSEKSVPAVEAEVASNRPVIHLEMPPPPLSISAPPPALAPMPTTPAVSLVQSPTTSTPGPLSLTLSTPVFSSSVAAAVSPSPVRKKLSLSDYTKRSKAREVLGGEGSSVSSLGKELKDRDDVSPTSATAITPTRESNADADEAIAYEVSAKEPLEQASKHESTEAATVSTAMDPTTEAAKTETSERQAPIGVMAPTAAMGGSTFTEGPEDRK